MVDKFIYIYNPIQAIWFINHGLIPVDLGTGNKGDAFLKFVRDDKFEKIFSEWCNK